MHVYLAYLEIGHSLQRPLCVYQGVWLAWPVFCPKFLGNLIISAHSSLTSGGRQFLLLGCFSPATKAKLTVAAGGGAWGLVCIGDKALSDSKQFWLSGSQLGWSSGTYSALTTFTVSLKVYTPVALVYGATGNCCCHWLPALPCTTPQFIHLKLLKHVPCTGHVVCFWEKRKMCSSSFHCFYY